MNKRGKSRLLKEIAAFKILLLVISTIAISVILSENSVSACNPGGQCSPPSNLQDMSSVVSVGKYLQKGTSTTFYRAGPQLAAQSGGAINAGDIVQVQAGGKTIMSASGGTMSLEGGVNNAVNQGFLENTQELTPLQASAWKGGVSDLDALKAISPSNLDLAGVQKLAGFENAKAIEAIPESAGGGLKVTMEDGSIKSISGKGAITGAGANTPAGYTGSITGMTGTMGGIVEGLVWAGIAYMAGQMIGSMLGLQKKQTQALSTALAAGAFTYQFTQGAFGWSAAGAKGAALGGLGGAAVAAIGVAAVVFVLMYKKETKKDIKFTCMPYEPPLGGAKCEQCNNDVFRPCTEYRCKALGQACELRNKDSPGKEMCVWVNKGDVASPTITTWDAALYPLELKYKPDTTRPPALGTKVVRPGAPGECLQAFTPLSFGITTNEPAQCKIDWNHTANFEQMKYYFGETNLFMYNHTQTMRLPGPDAFSETNVNASSGLVSGAPVFKNDGTTTLFVRCTDANGNQNVDEFAFTFCVDKSPDTTPPLVEGTSIPTGSPVQFDVQSIPVDVYVNEPATCKWSIDSKAYDDLENNMTCTTEPSEINAQMTYICTGNFTGIKNDGDNKYYIRCKDQPEAEEKDRNVMTQSYELVLRGTRTLNINHVAPNGTVSGSTDAVKVDLEVETEHGSNEGTAFCYFSGTGENASYIPMFETNNFRHKQTLQLASGDYTYYFRCVDLGGNSAEATTSFSVHADKEAPRVTSVYNEEGMGLKVVTNEDAECVYSLTSCSYVFKDAIDAKTVLVYSNANNRRNSYAEWKPNTVYYIKCRDDYGNEPNPSECSVIAMPTPQMKP